MASLSAFSALCGSRRSSIGSDRCSLGGGVSRGCALAVFCSDGEASFALLFCPEPADFCVTGAGASGFLLRW